MKRKIIIGLIIVAIIISGIIFFIFQQKPKQVAGYTIGKGNYEEVVSAIGYVEYEVESTVQAEISGRIHTLNVKEGDRIEVGQIIAQFDDSDAKKLYQDLEGSVTLAEARYKDSLVNYNASSTNVQEQRQTKEVEMEGYKLTLRQLELELQKMQELYNEGIIALSELEELKHEEERIQNTIEVAQASLKAMNNPTFASQELKASVDVAKMNLDQQKTELDKYSVYSPYDAIVLETYVNSGDYIQSAQELIKIGSVDQKVVWVDIDEKYIGKVQLGQTAVLTAESYPDNQYQGEIVEFNPSINRDTGTISVKIEIAEGKDAFIRNMSVKVDVTTVEYDDVVLVPGEYIYNKEDTAVLMVDNEGVVFSRSIIIQNQNKQMIYVLDGLDAGEVIIEPKDLVPGDIVKIEAMMTDIEKRVDD
jgi:HlyD family secretion protein